MIRVAFSAKSFLSALTIFVLLFSFQAKALDYYWVNGDGNWSDYSSHWATTSGGTIFHTTIPKLDDDVFFDSNSFSVDSQSVFLDSTFAYCNNMDWSGVNYKVRFVSMGSSTAEINIYGSLTLDADIYYFSGVVNFMGTLVNHNFEPAGVMLNSNIFFNGTGTYNLNSDLNCLGINFINGVFNSNNYSLNALGIGTSVSNPVEVNLGSSDLYCEGMGVYSNAIFNSSACNLYLSMSWAYQPILACQTNVTFKNIYFTGNSGEIWGPVTADTIMFSGTGTIRNNPPNNAIINCNYLYFSSGATVQVGSGVASEVQYAEFLGNISFIGEITFGTLFFNNTGKYIYQGYLNIIDTIIFTGSCTNPTQINGCYINKSTGTVAFDYVQLQNTHVSGGAVFIANNSIDAGGNTGWQINTPASRDLYWVNGQGQWNDINHWSLSSGGTGGNCPPTLTDNVIYDTQSFLTTSDTIFFPPSDIFCNNFTVMGGINFIPVLKNYSYLNFDVYVYGSLIALSEISISTTIFLKSNSIGNIIETHQNRFDLNFSGAGEWSLNDSLLATGMTFKSGTFNSNNHNISTGTFISDYSSPMPIINLGSSIVTCLYFDLSNLGAAFNGQNTTLIFDSTLYSSYWYSFKSNNQVFNNIYCSAKMRINGAFSCNELVLGSNDSIHSTSAIIQKLTLYDNSYFAGNLTVDSLIQIIPGKKIEFDAGTTLNVGSSFQANGASCNEINLLVADSAASIIKTSGSVDLDFVQLENINATGGAAFNATNTIDGGGNSGWTISSPVSRDLYWVGAAGNWSDQSHWALASGGPGGNCIPTILDNVFIDDNSFNQFGFESVTIDLSEVYLKNLNYDVTYSPSLKQIHIEDNDKINVHGSLIFNYRANFNGGGSADRPNFVLHSVDSGNTIKSSITQLGNILVACTGSYSLVDSLLCDAITFESGLFYSDGIPINCNKLNVISPQASVDFGINTLYCDTIDVALAGAGLQSQDLNVIFSKLFISNNQTFKTIKSGGGNSTITGGVTCETIELLGPTYFGYYSISNVIQADKMVVSHDFNASNYHYFVIDSLVLNNAGHTVMFGPGDTLNIISGMSTNATASFPVELKCFQPYNFIIESSTGMLCLDNMIMQGVHVIGGGVFYAGANTVNLGNCQGWTYASCNPANSNVWPGDANYDLIVNNYDVLNVGLGYNVTGPVRPGASNNWVAQTASDWTYQFANGANLKNADCNGDGIISNTDTIAISQNYGFTHPLRLSNPGTASPPGPPFYLIATPDTVMEGDTVLIDIFLGTAQFPVDSIYGLAFTLSFDSTLIDTTYMPFDYSVGWMGVPNVDLLTFEKKFLSQGMVDVAITRTDLFNIGGEGIVLTTGVVIIDNIGAKLTSAPPYVNLPITISNVRAVTASEYYFSLSHAGDQVEIDTLGTTGLTDDFSGNGPIRVFPNPANEKIHVVSEQEPILKLEIFDKLGVVLQTSYTNSRTASINTTSLRPGIYFLESTTKKGKSVTKIVVAHLQFN